MKCRNCGIDIEEHTIGDQTACLLNLGSVYTGNGIMEAGMLLRAKGVRVGVKSKNREIFLKLDDSQWFTFDDPIRFLLGILLSQYVPDEEPELMRERDVLTKEPKTKLFKKSEIEGE